MSRFTGFLVATLALGATVHAAGARPFFQVPGSCGQVWHASTYSNHWPDPDSLDLATRKPDLTNICEGEPVRAAAAGTVTTVWQRESDGENRIFIDHGDGWLSHYIHIQNPLPNHLKGQKVAQGQVIAYTGDTGNTVPHIHFTQLADDKAVRSAFSGDLVSTRQADSSTWGHWGTKKAEKLMSGNCGGESFMLFKRSGSTYMLIYKPGTGLVKIVRIHANGKGTTTTWTGEWSLGYTHMVAYKVNGLTSAILYKASTGHVAFITMKANGAGYNNVVSGTWGKGWTNIVPFQVGGSAYLFVYNQLTGRATFELVNNGNAATANIYQSTWEFGRTVVMPYKRDRKHYLLMYKGGDGEAKFFEVNFASNSVSVTLRNKESWTGDWSHMTAYYHGTTPYCVAYKQETGKVKFLRLDANGQGATTMYSSFWSKPWTHFTYFTIGNRPAMFLYKTLTGSVLTIQFLPSSSSYTNVWTTGWTTGYN